ncbi:hypothetical protein COLO4_24533 [Corchorus olitorius]|uniref:Protein PHYTOCHROME KINASE SUBSTRATE 1-like n=1 Tax=Corchorus olitorius TaxID=93759 RepID=A0A1R3I9F2_9ROSI|nr:hypothetical protein COLO4_24533 [Corchorus olitorius]
MDGGKKNTGPGEVSFSSYVHKLAEPANQLPHPAIIAPSVGIHTPSRMERSKGEEGEISVFGAERYFNMRLDDENPRLDDDHKYGNLRMGNQVDPHQMTPRRWPGTPSSCSEASWNSQSTLLRSSMRNRYENRQKKVDGRSFFSTLSCTGACSDGKSVYVNQNVVDDGSRVHGKVYRQNSHRSINMDRRKLQPQVKFPVKDEFDSQSFDKMSVGSSRVLKPGLQNISVKSSQMDDDDPRKSLEVFGSTAIKKGDITKNLEKKLSMLTWDAIPNAQTMSSISRSSQVCDDIESDASSDLFEIDNISGTGQALFTRQESDGMSSCMTPYAPSETSIEWSVVTASAADCSASFVSDYDERKPVPGSKPASRLANTKDLRVKAGQRGRSGGILGCKSHKAVMVAEAHQHQVPKSVTPRPARLLQAEIKVKDLDSP